jgi:DNA-binding transcriptional LysR family regulator
VRIKSLETRLATPLFFRDSKGVTLTGGGSTLLRHARIILRQFELAESEFAGRTTDDVGHIRIFANTTAVTEFMPELLAEFLAARPRVTVDLQERLTRDIVDGVSSGSADIGVVAGPLVAPALEILHFGTDRLVMAVPLDHPLTQQPSAEFLSTLGYEHVGLHIGSTLHAFLREIIAAAGLTVSVRIRVRSFEAMGRMVEAGVGIGVMPESAATRHMKTMKIATLPLSDAWAVRERKIVVRQMDALSGSAQALIGMLVAQ